MVLAGFTKNTLGIFLSKKYQINILHGVGKIIKKFPTFITTNFDKNRKQNFNKAKFLLSIYQFPLFPQRSGFGYSWQHSRNTFYTNFLLNFLSNLNRGLIKNIYVKCIFLYKPCVQEIEIKKKFKDIKFINTTKKHTKLTILFN